MTRDTLCHRIFAVKLPESCRGILAGRLSTCCPTQAYSPETVSNEPGTRIGQQAWSYRKKRLHLRMMVNNLIKFDRVWNRTSQQGVFCRFLILPETVC